MVPLTAARRRAYARPLDAYDAVTSRVDETGTLRVVAHKAVTPDDPYITGHFPGLTLYPAVFLIEGVRQSVEHALLGDERDPFLEIMTVVSLRVLRPMLEGDVLVLTTTVTPDPAGTSVRARCITTRGGRNDDVRGGSDDRTDVLVARVTLDLAAVR